MPPNKRKCQIKLVNEESGRKKRSERPQFAASEITFTADEKREFLKALKENGLNVIEDVEKLRTYLPHRSAVEISFLIDHYHRKAAKVTKEEKSTVATESDHLAKWSKIFDELVSARFRKEGYTDLLPVIFQSFANKFRMDNPDSPVNYGDVYDYLADILEGRCPRELKTNEYTVILEMFTRLEELLNEMDLKKELDYLSKGSWWQKEEVDNEPSEESTPSNGQSSDGQQSGSQPSDEEMLNSYMSLPKVKMIQTCLNPLKIPLSLIEDQQKTIFERMRETV